MILNPIVQRELVAMLRTRRALALQVCLVAALSLLVVLRWPTDARRGELHGGAFPAVTR